jgi:hypothetical protein
MGDRMEAEGVAFLDDDAGGLAPHFDDEWFEHVSSSLGYSGRWCRSGVATTARVVVSLSQESRYRAYGINMAENFLPHFLSPQADGRMTDDGPTLHHSLTTSARRLGSECRRARARRLVARR